MPAIDKNEELALRRQEVAVLRMIAERLEKSNSNGNGSGGANAWATWIIRALVPALLGFMLYEGIKIRDNLEDFKLVVIGDLREMKANVGELSRNIEGVSENERRIRDLERQRYPSRR